MKKLATILSLVVLAFALAACASGPQTEFDAEVTSAQEVPEPVLGDATPMGSVDATLDGDTLVVDGSFSGLTGPATAAHIHGPAEEGATAPPVFTLDVDNATSGDISGTWTGLTDEQIEQLRAGMYYVNVHTDANPAGEIRGQLE